MTLLSGTAVAQSAAPDFFQKEELTGNWNGVRTSGVVEQAQERILC